MFLGVPLLSYYEYDCDYRSFCGIPDHFWQKKIFILFFALFFLRTVSCMVVGRTCQKMQSIVTGQPCLLWLILFWTSYPHIITMLFKAVRYTLLSYCQQIFSFPYLWLLLIHQFSLGLPSFRAPSRISTADVSCSLFHMLEQRTCDLSQ